MCVCCVTMSILTLVILSCDVSLIVGMNTLICSYSYAHLRLSRGFVVVCLLLYEHVCHHLNVQSMSSCHAMVLDFRCLTSNNLFHTIYGLHDLQHRAQYVLHYDINTECNFHHRFLLFYTYLHKTKGSISVRHQMSSTGRCLACTSWRAEHELRA